MENQNPQIPTIPPIPTPNIPTEQPTQVPPPLSKIPSIKYLKTIGIGMSIVSFCIAIAVIGYVVVLGKNATKQVACTMEAKLCPNGTSVGRIGPKCEFAACPTTTPTPTVNPATADWKEYQDIIFGFSIKYPKDWSVNAINNPDSLDKTNVNKRNITFNAPDKTQLEIQLEVNPNFKNDDEYISFIEKYSVQNKADIQEIYIDSWKANLVTEKNTSYGISALVPSNPPPLPLISNAFFAKNGKTYLISIYNPEQVESHEILLKQILSTFKFTDITPTPTCIQRPACLDATPRCLIPEPANGWCPNQEQTCNTDSDCQNGATCVASGPLIANQAPKKICLPKGQATPL